MWCKEQLENEVLVLFFAYHDLTSVLANVYIRSSLSGLYVCIARLVPAVHLPRNITIFPFEEPVLS